MNHEQHSCCGSEQKCSCGSHSERQDEQTCSCGSGHNDRHDDHGCSCGGSHNTCHDDLGCSCGDHGDQDCGCGCGHSHSGHLLLYIGISAALLLVSFFLPQKSVLWRLTLCAAYLLSGFPVLKAAFEHILRGRVFDECFLMTVASVGALILGEWQEGVAVMVLYQLGEYLQGRAVASSRRSIAALMNVRPDSARVETPDGLRDMPAEQVLPGAVIEVRPGERIPLDAVVLDGSSALDQAALTGESLPEEVKAGDSALAGCVNLGGVLRLRVEKPFSDSAASRILRLVEEASGRKARTEQFITRFARVYTPVVVLAALALAVLPPLLGLGLWSVYLYRALDFLVISCPCALVISVPLTYFAGLGCASRSGILIKGGNYLDVLARAETAAFDKTGTLTEGSFAVTELLPDAGFDAETLLMLAAHAECTSTHPLAKSVLQAFSGEIFREKLSQHREVAGGGVRCLYDGRMLLAGKADFLAQNGITVPDGIAGGTHILVAYDGRYAGVICLSDKVKQGSAAALACLRELGVVRTVLLSGDHSAAVTALQEELGITEAYGELLPGEKVAHFERLRANKSRKGTVLYTGDGINDAPVLALADVGIAMGGLGTDAAMEAADVVIMGDDPQKIPQAIRIARKTGRVAKENIVLAIGVKLAVMLLAVFGHVELWTAVFADVGVCLLAVLNSLRASSI